MATNRINALREQFKQETQKREQGTTGTGQSNFYPFTKMQTGQRAVLRFLPDKDTSNPKQFLFEKHTHTLILNGKARSVPCLKNYGEACPICEVSSQYYKAEDKVNGKKYYKKQYHLAQALIVEDPLPPNPETNETHQGKVRFLNIGFQIYNVIKEAFASEDDELLDDVFSHTGGYDFVLKQTQQGDYAAYNMGSKFVSRQRPLSDEEVEIAEENSVVLRDLLPANPGREKLQAMLDAALNDLPWHDGAETGSEAPARAPAPRAAAPAQPASRPATPAPAANVGDAGGMDDDDEIFAAIKARRQRAAGQ